MRNKLALVTGAGRGIGRAVAERLGKEGMRVALVARTHQELDRVEDAIVSAGGHAHSFVCDISDPEHVAELHAEVEHDAGPVSILVNNAGVAPSAKLENTTDELWAQTIGVNLSGAFYMSRAFVPRMKENGGGRIVMIASTAAFEGFAYTSAYTASKHGLLGLTRALAVELQRTNIQVNAICPGFVRTRIVEESVARLTRLTGKGSKEAEAQFAGMNKEGRLIEPDEIASTLWELIAQTAFLQAKRSMLMECFLIEITDERVHVHWNSVTLIAYVVRYQVSLSN